MFEKNLRPRAVQVPSPPSDQGLSAEGSPPTKSGADRLVRDQLGDDRATVLDALNGCADGSLAPEPTDRVEAWTSADWNGYLRDRVSAGALPGDVVERIHGRVGNLIVLLSVAAGQPIDDIITGELPDTFRRGGDLY